MEVKSGRFRNEIRNTGEDFIRGAGEGWGRSAGPIVRKMKIYKTETR